MVGRALLVLLLLAGSIVWVGVGTLFRWANLGRLVVWGAVETRRPTAGAVAREVICT